MTNKLVQNGGSNAVTTSEAEQNASQEIAQLKLLQAEKNVKDAEVRFSIGTITESDLQKIKLARDMAAAEVKGDNAEVARLKLAAAELDLDVAGKKFAIGKATQQEYDQAKLARDIAAAAQNLSFNPTSDFYIGQAGFPEGDSIEINSVERNENQMTVKGHYNLVSHDKAFLALNFTTTNDTAVQTDSRQQMQISKGEGDFELTHPRIVPGLPHVNMYPAAGGEPFAELYFGTKAEAAEEGKMKLRSALSFGPVLERTIYYDKTGKDWLLNLETGETFSLPPGLTWEKNFSAVLEWLHLRGIHLMGFTAFSQNWHEGDPVPAIVVLDQSYGFPEASKRGLFGFEMQAAIMQAKGLTFETITPQQISNALQKLVVPAKGNNVGPFLPQFAGMAWHDTAWQGTDDYLYVFQTDDGQSGVLQITGFTDNPRGVKIRYKLVQNSHTIKVVQRPADSSELLEAEARLAEIKKEYGANSSEASEQQRKVDELASAAGDEKASRRICIGNLRQLDAAKEMWALDNKKQKGDLPTVADLLPYLGRNQQFPVCPDGGTYDIKAIGEAPTCSVSGHAIPDYKP